MEKSTVSASNVSLPPTKQCQYSIVAAEKQLYSKIQIEFKYE